MAIAENTTNGVLAANPSWTYSQAVGYVSGQAAAKVGFQFAGLSETDWQFAIDDYAYGYRKGYHSN